MKNESISVIMSVYKESKEELENSIYSILNQTYNNFEFIIVIDCPEEKWRIDFINNINDKRIKMIINEKNIGLPKSLNKAIKLASGNYIARMDADDISEKNRFEKQLEFLKKNQLDLCGSYINCFFNNKNVKKNEFPLTPYGIHKMIYYKNCVAHPTYFAKRELYNKLKEYKDIYTNEDYEFLIRADKSGFKIGNCPKVLLNYRLTHNSISRTNPGKQVLISNYIKEWYKNNEKEISKEDVDKYLNSEEYKKNIKKYDGYWKIRNIRNAKRKNIFLFLFYTLKSFIYFKITLNELYILYLNKKIKKHERNCL